jgi:hypothetical protein
MSFPKMSGGTHQDFATRKVEPSATKGLQRGGI